MEEQETAQNCCICSSSSSYNRHGKVDSSGSLVEVIVEDGFRVAAHAVLVTLDLGAARQQKRRQGAKAAKTTKTARQQCSWRQGVRALCALRAYAYFVCALRSALCACFVLRALCACMYVCALCSACVLRALCVALCVLCVLVCV